MGPSSTHQLHHAASLGDVASLALLLESEVAVNQHDGAGWTALHHAAFNNQYRACSLLMQHPQCKVDAISSTGETPLSLAALRRHRQVAGVLLEGGASTAFVMDPNDLEFVQNVSSLIPCTSPAIRGVDTDMHARFLRACSSGDIEAVKQGMQQAGQDPGRADARGWTGMHYAAVSGHVAVLQVLLGAGCSPDAPLTPAGETPISLAALARKQEACKALLDAGASASSVSDPSDRAYLDSLAPGRSSTTTPMWSKPVQSPRQERSSLSPRQEPSWGGSDSMPDESKGVGSLVFYGMPPGSAPDPAQVLASWYLEAGVTGHGAMGVGVVLKEEELTTAGGPDLRVLTIRDLATGSMVRMSANQVTHLSPAEGQLVLDTLSRLDLKVRKAPAHVSATTTQATKDKPATQSPRLELNQAIDRPGLPEAARRAWPMYVPCSTRVAQLFPRPPRTSSWALHPLLGPDNRYAGCMADPKTGLVFWRHPDAPEHPQDVGTVPAPVLIGRLRDAVSPGSCIPPGARVVPLSLGDALHVEYCAYALRCVRHSSPVAKVLAGKSRFLTDLAPELDTSPYLTGTSLMVPICVLLGITQLSELKHVTERELKQVSVCPSFLPVLKALGRKTLKGEQAQDWCDYTRELNADTDHGVLQLLLQHNLLKLLPLAQELSLLTPGSAAEWSCLVDIAPQHMFLSTSEMRRLRALAQDIQAAVYEQTQIKTQRTTSLARAGPGNLVLYDVPAQHASNNGAQRQVGVVLTAPGPDATIDSLFTVRDLLGDAVTRVSSGQIMRASWDVAAQYLRADLLPPTTQGPPVTPFTAATGQLVQLVGRWHKDHCTTLSKEKKALLNPFVIGMLVGPAAEGSQELGAAESESDLGDGTALINSIQETASGVTSACWYVQWPDGSLLLHRIGDEGVFELCHLHMHRLAGAPVLASHLDVSVVVRGPLQPLVNSVDDALKCSDDVVAGTPGLVTACEDNCINVIWSRSRTYTDSVCRYTPDENGVFPLCHGLLAEQQLTCLAAKPGVQVEVNEEDAAAADDLPVGSTGTLVAPVRLGELAQGVVWQVRWHGGQLTEVELPVLPEMSTLKVSSSTMLLPGQGAVPLNELQATSCAATGGEAAVHALAGATVSAATTVRRFPDTASRARAADLGRLGRPLFTSDLAPRSGLLGTFVKLNLEASTLQPYCEEGPLKAYTPRTPSEVLEAQRLNLPPAPVDDIGWVVKDAGAGQWRSLLVRKLGTLATFWYDEGVLLPASQLEIMRQMKNRPGVSFLPPLQEPGVPVTDANAGPGMLVMRSYTCRDVHEGMQDASMVGQLIKQTAPHQWEVAWRDGSRGRYLTGFKGRFQLCHVNLHEEAGAPFQELDGDEDVQVMAGLHCNQSHFPGSTGSGAAAPSSSNTHIKTVKASKAAFHDDEVVEFDEERIRLLGRSLGLYELSHACQPRSPLTIWIAKAGLRVMRAADMPPAGATLATLTSNLLPQVGVLLRPVRLEQHGPELNARLCWWEVQWEGGLINEVPIGVNASETPLQVALGGGVRSASTMARSLMATKGALRHLQQQSYTYIKGSQPVITCLLTIQAKVQLACIEALEERCEQDLKNAESFDAGSYQFKEYLEKVVHPANRALHSMDRACKSLRGAHQQDLREVAAEKSELFTAWLPRACASIWSSALGLCQDSVKRVLQMKGSTAQLSKQAKVDLTLDDMTELVQSIVDKPSKTASALHTSMAQLQQLKEVVPSDHFYCNAMKARIQQQVARVALAAAACASEWATTSCVLLHQMNDGSNSFDSAQCSELVQTCLNQLQQAVTLCDHCLALTEPSCRITAAAADGEEDQARTLTVADLQAMPELPASELTAVDASDMLDVQPTAQVTALNSTAQDGTQVQIQEAGDSELSNQHVAAAIQATLTEAAEVIHAYTSVLVKHTPVPNALDDLVKQLGETLAGSRVVMVVSSQLGGEIFGKLLSSCSSNQEARQKVAGLVDSITKQAKTASDKVTSLSVKVAEKQAKEGSMPGRTPASVMCEVLAELTLNESDADVTAYWARAMAAQWATAAQDIRASFKEQAVKAVRLVGDAVSQAKELVQAAEAKIGEANRMGVAAAKAAAEEVAAAARKAVTDASLCEANAQAAADAITKDDLMSTAMQQCQPVFDAMSSKVYQALDCVILARQAAAAALDVASASKVKSVDSDMDSAVEKQIAQARREVQLLLHWSSELAGTCCLRLLEDWGGKDLDQLAAESLEDGAAEEWYRWVLCSGAKPTDAGPARDKAIQALTGLYPEILRTSTALYHASGIQHREGLDEAVNTIFKAVMQTTIQELAENGDRFMRKLEPCEGEPEDQGPPLTAAQVAEAYGYAHAAQATLDAGAALLKLMPMVIPVEDGVLQNLRGHRKEVPLLMQRAKKLEARLGKQEGCERAFADFKAALMQKSPPATQQVVADAGSMVKSARIAVEQRQAAGERAACFNLQLVGEKADKAQAVLQNEEVQEAVQPYQEHVQQLGYMEAMIEAAAGTSWHPNTLKLRQQLQQIRQDWDDAVSRAVQSLAPVYL